MNVTVALKNEKSRYEAAVDAKPAGFISYQVVDGDVLDLQHTEVDDAFAGQGVGGELVRQTLDQIRAVGKKVKPSCPFVEAWIGKNPQYADLVAN